MTTYVAPVSEVKIREILRKMRKEDTLIIYYNSKEKQVPIDMIELFSSTKGKVIFKEYKDDITFAFEVGMLFSETSGRNNSLTEIIGDSGIFGKIRQITGERPARAGVKKTVKKPKETDPGQLSIRMEDIEPQKNNSPVQKKTQHGKNKDTTDEQLFDEAYGRFEKLLAGLKTKAYDPSSAEQGIFNALRLMKEEGTDFKEGLEKNLSKSAKEKFFAQISPQDMERIKESGMEVIKYDAWQSCPSDL